MFSGEYESSNGNGLQGFDDSTKLREPESRSEFSTSLGEGFLISEVPGVSSGAAPAADGPPEYPTRSEVSAARPPVSLAKPTTPLSGPVDAIPVVPVPAVTLAKVPPTATRLPPPLPSGPALPPASSPLLPLASLPQQAGGGVPGQPATSATFGAPLAAAAPAAAKRIKLSKLDRQTGVVSASTGKVGVNRLVGVLVVAATFAVAAFGAGVLWSLIGAPGAVASSASSDAAASSEDGQSLDPETISGEFEPEDFDGGAAPVVQQLDQESLLDDLEGVAVPKLCDHPEGRLVDGVLPVPSVQGRQSGGGAWLPWVTPTFSSATGYTRAPGPIDEAVRERSTLFVDLTGDGLDDLVVLMSCYMGGVSWPQEVVAYESVPDGTMELLGGVNLGEISSSSRSGGVSMTALDGAVNLFWDGPASGGLSSNAEYVSNFEADLYWDGAALTWRNFSETAK